MSTWTTEARFDGLKAAISWVYRDSIAQISHIEKIWGSDQESHWEILASGTHMDLEGAEKAAEELREAIRLVKTIESWELVVEEQHDRTPEDYNTYRKATYEIVKLLRAGKFDEIETILEG